MAHSVTADGFRGYGSLIKNYVQFLLHKLRFHRTHPEFNGTFDYEEYISLKNIDDPNEGYEQPALPLRTCLQLCLSCT